MRGENMSRIKKLESKRIMQDILVTFISLFLILILSIVLINKLSSLSQIDKYKEKYKNIMNEITIKILIENEEIKQLQSEIKTIEPLINSKFDREVVKFKKDKLKSKQKIRDYHQKLKNIYSNNITSQEKKTIDSLFDRELLKKK